MAKKHSAIPDEISVEVDGKTYTGSYVVEGGTITVTYGLRKQSTHAQGGPSDVHLARRLLRELVSGGSGLD